MTRVFTDGAEMGDLLFFDALSGSNYSASTVQKRSGAYAYLINNTTNAVMSKTVTAVSEFYLRVGLYIGSATVNGSYYLFSWKSGSTTIGSVRFLDNGSTKHLMLYVGASLVATTTFNVTYSSWFLFELHVKIADSNGVVEVKIDGVADATGTFTGDTKPDTNTTINTISFTGTDWNMVMYFDDLAMNDVNGGVDDTWCGDGKIIILKPNANGDSSDLVGSDGNSTDNYLLVDEVPSDGDTTYVESTVVDDYDLYNLEACGLSGVTINRVQVVARGRDTAASGGEIGLRVKTNSSEYTSSNIALVTTYTQDLRGPEYLTNPQSAGEWSTSELDALQVGAVVKSV